MRNGPGEFVMVSVLARSHLTKPILTFLLVGVKKSVADVILVSRSVLADSHIGAKFRDLVKIGFMSKRDMETS